MTIGHFLPKATAQLQQAGIETPRLDVLILLEDALGIGRAHLLAHPETSLPPTVVAELNNKITQRKTHLPLAYIRSSVSFYGRVFRVTKHVLIPRPESESMIELFKKTAPPPRARVADIGTGSGCLGITAALEMPDATVELYDTSPHALAVARRNARLHHVVASVKRADLLEGLSNNTHYHALLANLPYVPDGYPINKAAAHEPPGALFAGADGMGVYRRFWEQITKRTRKPAYVITETLTEQHAENIRLAASASYQLKDTIGLAQLYTLNADR